MLGLEFQEFTASLLKPKMEVRAWGEERSASFLLVSVESFKLSR